GREVPPAPGRPAGDRPGRPPVASRDGRRSRLRSGGPRGPLTNPASSHRRRTLPPTPAPAAVVVPSLVAWTLLPSGQRSLQPEGANARHRTDPARALRIR